MDFTIETAKENYNNSKAKTLIYQTASRGTTPQKTRKELRKQKTEVPFATVEENKEELYPQVFHKIVNNKNVHDKVGADKTFDPKVYKDNLEFCHLHQSDSRLRNFNGNGNILAHKGGEKGGDVNDGNCDDVNSNYLLQTENINN